MLHLAHPHHAREQRVRLLQVGQRVATNICDLRLGRQESVLRPTRTSLGVSMRVFRGGDGCRAPIRAPAAITRSTERRTGEESKARGGKRTPKNQRGRGTPFRVTAGGVSFWGPKLHQTCPVSRLLAGGRPSRPGVASNQATNSTSHRSATVENSM